MNLNPSFLAESDESTDYESDESTYDESTYDESYRGESDYGSEAAVTGGKLNLGGGKTAYVRLSAPVVSQRDFSRAMKNVKREIRSNQRSIRSHIAKLEKNLDRKLKKVNSRVEQSSMLAFLPLLMAPKPAQLASLTIAAGTNIPDAGELKDPATLTIKDSTYTGGGTDSMLNTLMIVMLMSGGLFGGAGSGETEGNILNTMLPLLIIAPILSQQK